MIEILDVIRKRRSVRKYQPRPVQDKLVKEVLTAAGWAPSAHNAQPWRFIILPDVLVKRELAEAMAESWASDFAKDGLNIEPEMLKFRVDRFASAP
ncbi:MAG TPA: nitroreductase family protein, partial [Verrucomicrobiae bacterium]|nr:nitroreductase family protein [Verrucomicrobiae bacterium]